MARALIGTSGWNYKHWWNGVFYEKTLRPPHWLNFFSATFDTVEINNSFYRLPTENAFKNWRKQVPDGFVFAVKASRFLTHIKRLKDPADPLDLFFSRARHLGNRLGPILFQLPPRFKINLARLEVFLRTLRQHPVGKRCRIAVEVRDASWLASDVFDLMRRFKACLCFADWKEMHVNDPVTTDYVYVRRHYGTAGGGNYSRRDLNADVKQIRQWLNDGLDVYFYFNNDMQGHAIRNAQYIRNALAR